jgi:putative hemolysin
MNFWSDVFGTIPTALLLLIPVIFFSAVLVVMARLYPEELLLKMVRPMWFFTMPLLPFANFFVGLEDKVWKMFSNDEEPDAEDREDIIAAVADGEHDGVVQEGEREMIQNIFDLKNFDISDVMTPRTDVCAVDISGGIDAAIDLAIEKGYSRIPVYEENRDNIKGIFYVKDILNYWALSTTKKPELQEIMREPFYVPETKNIGELMDELQHRKLHMAMVLDEYGGTAGLVTIEDIVEEIVGEIQDEYDEEEQSLISTVSDGVFEVDSRLHVHDMNEALTDKVIPETDDYETIGGFVLDRLGHVPEPSEFFIWEGLKFTIISADEKKIETIKVEKLPEEDIDEEALAS